MALDILVHKKYILPHGVYSDIGETRKQLEI